MSSLYDAYIEPGTDWFIKLALTNPDGTAFDLTGYTAAITFTQNGSTVITPTVVFDADRTQGLLTISLTHIQTATLTNEGQYTLDVTSGSSVVTRILYGNYNV